MLTQRLPRVSIGHLPTPLEPLPRLTAELGGPQLWIKRDDQTGLATGGNKTRKLEFIVADALSRGADSLITCGAAQSNHARQTAAAAARFGLGCTLVLRGIAPDRPQGNLLLDNILGAEVVWSGDRAPDEYADEIAAVARDDGRSPYLVPYGGSNPIGASGYVAAMEELLDQCESAAVEFDYVVTASSSGGTQAGLTVGAIEMGYRGTVLGISVDLPSRALQERVASLASATARHLGLAHRLAPSDINVNDSYLGCGYGIVGELERAAIVAAARSEGLLLDPVYTGRAFGGLLDLVRRGLFLRTDRVLFWHTGGTPALFAYSDVVLM